MVATSGAGLCARGGQRESTLCARTRPGPGRAVTPHRGGVETHAVRRDTGCRGTSGSDAPCRLGKATRRPHRMRVRRGTRGRDDLYGTVTLTLVKTFDDLYAELADKARTRPAGSGTVAALDAGVHAIGKKIVEEAAEVWMAAEHEGTERTAEEISQLLYHLQVLMLACDISPDDVYTHL